MTFPNYTIFNGTTEIHTRNDGLALSYQDYDDTNVFTVLIATSGNLSVKELESSFVDKNEQNSFMYICLEGHIPNLKFTYSVEDVSCGDCLFLASTKITLLRSDPLIHQRKRRSIFDLVPTLLILFNISICRYNPSL